MGGSSNLSSEVGREARPGADRHDLDADADADARALRVGAIDMHVHAGPDLKPRAMDAFELARAVRDAGMRGVVLKDHRMATADRAAMARAIVPGPHVFGSIVLNRSVGGFNPAAVEAAIAFGAKVVWMPTNTSASHRRARGLPFGDGLSIFADGLAARGRVRPEVEEVCRLVAAAGAVLATGHLHATEVEALLPLARAHGVERFVVTHPDNRAVAMDDAACEAAARTGATLELCYRSLAKRTASAERLAGIVRRVGPERCVLATDLGDADLEPPVRGMLSFIRSMLREGVDGVAIATMTRTNPSALLGLG